MTHCGQEKGATFGPFEGCSIFSYSEVSPCSSPHILMPKSLVYGGQEHKFFIIVLVATGLNNFSVICRNNM